jgi:hypothetical protein
MKRRLSCSILGRSESPPYGLHRRGHRPRHLPHHPSQNQSRPIWPQAQARHLESGLWVPAGQSSASVDRYINGTSVKQLGIRNSFHRMYYVAYDVPHLLHALYSRWPLATTFEVLASDREAIYRCHIPIFRRSKPTRNGRRRGTDAS